MDTIKVLASTMPLSIKVMTFGVVPQLNCTEVEGHMCCCHIALINVL